MTGRESRERLRMHLRGAVQGVGFRPFVYRLATELGLAGWVMNDTRGVVLEVEGSPDAVATFERRVVDDRPPRAVLLGVDSRRSAAAGDRGGLRAAGFEIRASDGTGGKTVVVLPDVATCDACRREVDDPRDRRHGYPFTNCTDCGPRYSIVRELPYDRPHTTMAGFALCAECAAEYRDPTDRRFHAQPNACPVCGPRLALRRQDGSIEAVEGGALDGAAAAIRSGEIVAVKGLGGFHLLVDAADDEAVDRLRRRKQRWEKPLAIMAASLEEARTLVRLSPAEERLLCAPEAPIVLARARTGAAVAAGVAPGNPRLGVMLAYTPLHHLLLSAVGRAVVATSGNLSDEPIAIDEDEALERLGGIADRFLVHDRPIARHVDDSLAWVHLGETRLLRRARGYAPLPVTTRLASPTLLAVGAHQKNAVALSLGREVFLSQHIGDMETPQALAAFERVIADLVRLYDAEPAALVHDLHPDYPSTAWARRATAAVEGPLAGLPRVGVQHHHAHLASCLAENGHEGPALGVTWDGTGWGPDGTVWGGELLLGDALSYRRVASLRPFRLPGGEAAVREPRRVAFALLFELLGDEAAERVDLAPVAALEPSERRLLSRMLRRGVRSPVTTSVGRLFDGFAAILGVRQRVSYEGQAAVEMEHLADRAQIDGRVEPYPMPLVPPATDADGPSRLDWGATLRAALADLAAGVAPGIISARFHEALAAAVVAAACEAGEETVALTGGCFQNRRLTRVAATSLESAGFRVLLHRQVPPNDGGIALGQVAVAAACLRSPEPAGSEGKRGG